MRRTARHQKRQYLPRRESEGKTEESVPVHPSSPSPRKKGPGLNITSGWSFQIMRATMAKR